MDGNDTLKWFNKSVATILNAMFKILEIMSLRLYIYLINLDLDSVLSTQIWLFPLCKCTKIDWSRPKWTQWTKFEQMEQSGPNGLNRIKWTE